MDFEKRPGAPRQLRRKRCCAALGANASQRRGWPTTTPSPAPAAHSSSSGAASSSADRAQPAPAPRPARRPAAGPTHISRHSCAPAYRCCARPTSREVRHCSRCRRLTAIRHSVRTIASRLYCASCGSRPAPEAMRAKCCMPARKASAQMLVATCTSGDFCTSVQQGADSSGGTSTIASTASVHDSTGDSTQPADDQQQPAATAGTRLRRRLSRIFQRDSAVSALRRQPSCAVGARGSIHGSICQSPRIQRWRRLHVGAVARRDIPRTAARRRAGPQRAWHPRSGRG